MDKIKVGIIGAGGIVSRLHLPGLAAVSDFEVKLVAGRKESRLKILCDKFKIPAWTQNYDAVIADKSIDAVLVGTPHPHHVAWGIKAIQAGKHVLVEKPLCADMTEADAFVAAAEGTDKTVMCMPHFGAGEYTLRKLVQEGAIGKVSGARCRTSHGGPEIYYAEIRDTFGEKEQDLWFFDAKRASVGALFDMGVYAVARLVAVLGTVKKVTGFVGTLDKPTELEDVATLILKMENGALATAETSWCDPGRTWDMAVHGTKGKFTMPGLAGALVTQWSPTSYTREDAPIQTEAVACNAGMGELHEHFRDCIRKGIQPPVSNAWTARHITEILLAGLESSRTGKAVDIRSSAED